jgi:predicted RNase H-like HicB family nuclease
MESAAPRTRIEPMVRVIYRQEDDVWVASSPEVPDWSVTADSFADARRLADDSVRFALDRGDIEIEHYVAPDEND